MLWMSEWESKHIDPKSCIWRIWVLGAFPLRERSRAPGHGFIVSKRAYVGFRSSKAWLPSARAPWWRTTCCTLVLRSLGVVAGSGLVRFTAQGLRRMDLSEMVKS